MSGTFTAVWVYVLAEIVGGIAAAVLYATVVGGATAPVMEDGDPQAGVSAGDRGLAGGMGTDDARTTPTNHAHQPQRWVEKVDRSITNSEIPQPACGIRPLRRI